MRISFQTMVLGKFSAIALCAAVLALAACGGGGGGATDPGTPQILDSFGRNAYGGGGGGSSSFGAGDSGADGGGGDGLPIVGAKVVITDATLPEAQTVTVYTDSTGYYRAKVTGFKPPLVAKLTRPDGVVRYSVSLAPLKVNGFVTMNINGLTSQIAADLALDAIPTGTVADLTPAMVNARVIATSLANIKGNINDVILAAGLNPASFDPIATPFLANFTGYDFVLDNVVVPSVPGANSTQPIPGFVPSNANGTGQPANLALAMTQARALFASINAVYAGTPTASQFVPFIASGFAGNGLNLSTAADDLASYPAGSQVTLGGLAPNDGKLSNGVAGVNVTFDETTNCVNTMWVKLNFNGFTHEYTRLDNTDPRRLNCANGSWQLAGSQRLYHARITPQLERLSSNGQTISRSGLFLETLIAQTTGASGYSHVEISGPGITTLGAYGSGGTALPVRLVPPSPGSALLSTRNLIDDPYYGSTSFNGLHGGAVEGSSMLQSCAEMTLNQTGNGAWGFPATTSTPCVDASLAVAGSDYSITYYNSQTQQILETASQRLDASLPDPAIGLPTSLFATVNSVTPASSTLGINGGTVTASWTLPAGIQPVLFGLNINDANTTTRLNTEKYLSASAGSVSLVLPTLLGTAGGAGSQTSFGYLITSVGGIMVLSGKPF